MIPGQLALFDPANIQPDLRGGEDSQAALDETAEVTKEPGSVKDWTA